MNRKHIFILIIGLVVVGLLYVSIGGFIRKRSVIVKETKDYIYVKKYALYNRDSTVYKYHQPIKYDGVVTRKYKYGSWTGLPGKGGVFVYHYNVDVQFNNTIHRLYGRNYYDMFNEGNKVIVIEKFWPYNDYEYILK